MGMGGMGMHRGMMGMNPMMMGGMGMGMHRGMMGMNPMMMGGGMYPRRRGFMSSMGHHLGGMAADMMGGGMGYTMRQMMKVYTLSLSVLTLCDIPSLSTRITLWFWYFEFR